MARQAARRKHCTPRTEACYRVDVETTMTRTMLKRSQYRGRFRWLKDGARGAKVALAAASLSVALGAPAPPFASPGGMPNTPRAASGALVANGRHAAPLPEMGVTQVPDHGRTQVPATPVTPRPHYARAPAHLP
ncbi:hypothetical protein [Caballeronia sp. M1242]|uniref:hypothetical protein n=1 Tax=Caballeronia sp. M1242 TaxID=2814653 RepID=UPI0019CF70A2|nr:hypothetical protein [Caballeronia sp. M1242]QSN62850.1 hypothetical protein JYK05_17030 [Caballeronia sp. M1242]